MAQKLLYRQRDRFMTNINQIRKLPAPLDVTIKVQPIYKYVDFPWSSVAPPPYDVVSDAAKGVVLNVNQNLTFTASTQSTRIGSSKGVLPTYFEWRMGDGTIAYGPTVVHVYRVATPAFLVHVKCLDNYGRKSYSSFSVTLYDPYAEHD